MENKEGLEHIRHSFAHLLAAAVLDLYPDAKPTLGPAIDYGFYYDFDFASPITDGELRKIEKKMREILKSWKKGEVWFSGEKVSGKDAKEQFANNEFKHELIDEISERGEDITLYTTERFTDLCRGGHAQDAEDLNAEAFALTHMAGAYWRGSEKNKMLTRIYGVAFETKEELEAHLKMLEEAKKRDHKKLGPQLDLFCFSPLVGSGLPLWTPKGTLIRNLLDDYVWELRHERGYDRVEIPHITKKELYETSGHWDKFKDELFHINTREGHEFALKPMNCPHHTQIFARKQWSYRELPQSYANTTMMYRDEQTGELAGLARVRAISIDDAHVFCRKTQVKEEMLKIWDIIDIFYKAVGLGNLTARLSFHDPDAMEKYLGSAEIWEESEQALMDLAKERGVEAEVALGEAAFYGPKIDFMAKDSIGRSWQVATIQLDMNMPERFDLTCIDENGSAERIVMIHAAIMGSIERHLAILIEHHAGMFPLWFSPVQARVIAVSEKFQNYAQKVTDELRMAGLRAELSDPNETLGKRIRTSEMDKIPYTLVVGEKEVTNGTVAVRHLKRGDEGEIKLEDLIENLVKEVMEKRV